MKKQLLTENDHELADITFKGKANLYAMQIAEYLVNRLEFSIPSKYKPRILDDGRVVIDLDDLGELEMRCYGNETYSTFLWIKGRGEKSLVKRQSQRNIRDTISFVKYGIEFVESISNGMAIAKATSKYEERTDEPNNQDAEWEENSSPLTHIQKQAGITRPKDESEYEYFTSIAQEKGMPTDHIRNTSLYDLSSIVVTDKKAMPSAGAQLNNRMNSHDGVPEKKKMQPVGNVVRLQEGVKVIKVNGMTGVYTASGVQWLEPNTIVERVSKKWGWDNKGRPVLRESIEKI